MEEYILQPPSGRTQGKRKRTNKGEKPGRPTYTYSLHSYSIYTCNKLPPSEGHTRMTLRVHHTRHCNGGCHHHYIFWTENVNASLDLWRLFLSTFSTVHTVFVDLGCECGMATPPPSLSPAPAPHSGLSFLGSHFIAQLATGRAGERSSPEPGARRSLDCLRVRVRLIAPSSPRSHFRVQTQFLSLFLFGPGNRA